MLATFSSVFSAGSATELIAISVYFVFLICVGVIFSRLVRNSQDYFKAGGQASWWLVGASMFMSGISTFTFVGNASGIFISGWSPLALYLANVMAYLVGGLFMGAWYRQMRIVTVAEAIRERFGKGTELTLSILMIVNGLVWTGAVLYGLALFMGILIPSVSQWQLIVVVGVIVLAYCTIGGNWAVMANDFAQGLIMVSVTVLVTVLAFRDVGGVSSFFDALSASEAATDLKFFTPLKGEGGFMKESYGLSWIVATFLVQFFNMISLFQGVRYFSAKDGREAQKSSYFAAILMAVGCLVFFVPPLYARVFLHEEVMGMHEDPVRATEYSYAVASRYLLPSGAFILMMVSMLAAAISSLDTGLNRNAALIVRNVLPSVCNMVGGRQISPDREVVLGRVFTVLLGLFIIAVALFYSEMRGVSLFDLMLSVGNMLMLPQFVPLVLFLFFRNTPGWSAIASMLAGFAPSLVDLAFDLGWSYQEKSLLIVGASVSVFAISMLFFSRVSKEKRLAYQDFYNKMETPVDYDSEVGYSSDAFQFKQVGTFSIFLGFLVLLLFFVESSVLGRWCIFSISGFVTASGLVLIWAGLKISRVEGNRTRARINN